MRVGQNPSVMGLCVWNWILRKNENCPNCHSILQTSAQLKVSKQSGKCLAGEWKCKLSFNGNIKLNVIFILLYFWLSELNMYSNADLFLLMCHKIISFATQHLVKLPLVIKLTYGWYPALLRYVQGRLFVVVVTISLMTLFFLKSTNSLMEWLPT